MVNFNKQITLPEGIIIMLMIMLIYSVQIKNECAIIPIYWFNIFHCFQFNLFQFKTYFKLSFAIKNEFLFFVDLMSYNIISWFDVVVFFSYIMYHYKTLGVIKRVSAVYNKTNFSFDMIAATTNNDENIKYHSTYKTWSKRQASTYNKMLGFFGYNNSCGKGGSHRKSDNHCFKKHEVILKFT